MSNLGALLRRIHEQTGKSARGEDMGNPIVHFDVNGPDGESLQRFYGDLFGWGIQPVPDIGYALVDTRSGLGVNGGIGTSQDGSSSVRFYAEADDLQAVLDRAESLGGKVALPITDMGMVTFALLADPDGLVVGVVKREPGQPSQSPSEGDGAAVDWFEVLGTDAERTQRFYTELFDWKLQDSSFPGYRMTESGTSGAAGGGIGSGDGPTWATVYAKVADVGAAMARAEELGGEKVYGPNDVMEGLRSGAIRDPAGNVFGVYSQA
jgi:uncharacterized protein